MDSSLAAVICTGLLTLAGVIIAALVKMVPKRANGKETLIATRLEYVVLNLNEVKSRVQSIDDKLDATKNEYGERLATIEGKLDQTFRHRNS